MDINPALAELLARIGLDEGEVQTRLRFLELDETDRQRMNRAATALAGSHADFVERLYEHLAHFEPMARVLHDPATLPRLKQRQREYYRQLWEGPYDTPYLQDRLHIGLVHQRVGIELKWYLGAYRLYLDQMLAQLLPSGEALETCRSLLKAAFFDMGLTADTYSAAQHQALEASEARFVRAARGSNDGIWDWDIDHDRLYVSTRWAAMLDEQRADFAGTGDDWFERVHPDDLAALRQAIDDHLDGHTPQLHHEYRIRRRGGEYLWVLVRGIADRAGGHRRIAGSQSDISRKKETEARLRHAARHDPLTGLANRARLDELLGQASRGRRDTGTAALLFVDLDRFKLINDSLGHAVGDQVLIEVARRLQHCLRQGDHLIRFGGDEFVALLHGLTCLEDAEQVAQRMLDSLATPLQVSERPLAITASIGIAPLDAQQDTNALQAADLALYRAKAQGKAQFARYSDDLGNVARQQLDMDSALALALERGEFELYYQPICRIDHARPQLVGVEALLRWRNGNGLVSPVDFIPRLEESGLIVPVGEWVLRESCRQTRAWQQQGHARLHCSVNISSRQLQRADFAGTLSTILAQTQLPPTSLVLEITESLLMTDDADTLHNLHEAARMGVRLALDDFGTGYSSLGYLTRFPLHILKLDRSFVDGTPADAERATICRAIIGLGTSLGLELIAEGVETLDHLHFLQREDCPHAQGYWFSRPRPANALQQLLDDGLFEGEASAATPPAAEPLSGTATP